ncbi:MAG: ankyrin repeat domain-containing protein [Pseudomonadota bacterium]
MENVQKRATPADPVKAFFEAVENGDTEKLRWLITEKLVDADQRIEDDITALHLAAFLGKDDCIKVLLELGADLNLHDKDDSTALFFAVNSGSLKIVKFLIENGGTNLITKIEKHDQTLLQTAVIQGHENIIKYLHEKDFTFNEKNKKDQNLAHLAAITGKAKTLELLISLANVDLEAKDKFGFKPIHHAAMNGNTNVIHILHKVNFDLNALDEATSTAAHVAARYGQHKVLILLARLGANLEFFGEGTSPNGVTIHGGSPLHEAAFHGHVISIQSLHAIGMIIDRKCKRNKTPFFVAVESIDEGKGDQSETIKKLKNFGANVQEICNVNGFLMNCVDIAAYKNNLKILNLLLDYGITPSLSSKSVQRLCNDLISLDFEKLYERYRGQLHSYPDRWIWDTTEGLSVARAATEVDLKRKHFKECNTFRDQEVSKLKATISIINKAKKTLNLKEKNRLKILSQNQINQIKDIDCNHIDEHVQNLQLLTTKFEKNQYIQKLEEKVKVEDDKFKKEFNALMTCDLDDPNCLIYKIENTVSSDNNSSTETENKVAQEDSKNFKHEEDKLYSSTYQHISSQQLTTHYSQKFGPLIHTTFSDFFQKHDVLNYFQHIYNERGNLDNVLRIMSDIPNSLKDKNPIIQEYYKYFNHYFAKQFMVAQVLGTGIVSFNSQAAGDIEGLSTAMSLAAQGLEKIAIAIPIPGVSAVASTISSAYIYHRDTQVLNSLRAFSEMFSFAGHEFEVVAAKLAELVCLHSDVDRINDFGTNSNSPSLAAPAKSRMPKFMRTKMNVVSTHASQAVASAKEYWADHADNERIKTLKDQFAKLKLFAQQNALIGIQIEETPAMLKALDDIHVIQSALLKCFNSSVSNNTEYVDLKNNTIDAKIEFLLNALKVEVSSSNISLVTPSVAPLSVLSPKPFLRVIRDADEEKANSSDEELNVAVSLSLVQSLHETTTHFSDAESDDGSTDSVSYSAYDGLRSISEGGSNQTANLSAPKPSHATLEDHQKMEAKMVEMNQQINEFKNKINQLSSQNPSWPKTTFINSAIIEEGNQLKEAVFKLRREQNELFGNHPRNIKIAQFLEDLLMVISPLLEQVPRLREELAETREDLQNQIDRNDLELQRIRAAQAKQKDNCAVM